MRRCLILTVFAFATIVAIANAALPKPGGTYKGYSNSHEKVSIVVARHPYKHNDYKATLRYCGRKVGIFIVRGGFGVHLSEAGGAVSVLRMSGHFSSRQKVSGEIQLDFTSGSCSRPGAWSATLQ